MSATVFTLQECPQLAGEFDRLAEATWPEFLLHAGTRHWAALAETFPQFQLLLCDDSGAVIGVGHTIPIPWDGTLDDLPDGIDAIMVRGVEAQRAGRPATVLSALAAIVADAARGQGHSYAILKAMRCAARDAGLTSLIAPVRPTRKADFPHERMDDYLARRRSDGLLFDPWLRVHERLGARLLKVAPQAMVVTGTVAEWEEWTGMRFPKSGEYAVRGALRPVNIDVERDVGRYEEPNVWMEHPLART